MVNEKPELAIALAALNGSVHGLMVLAGRGMMSPQEAQAAIDGMRQVFDL